MVSIHQSNDLIHGFNPFQYSYAPHLWTANYHPYYWNKYAYYGTSDQFEDTKLMAQTSASFDTQSDSDGSVSSRRSSYESITTIDIGLIQKKSVNDVKCCWKNCGLWFPTLDKLANHITKSHAASGPGGLFFCGWEGCVRNMRGFNARYKMLVHVRTHTNEKPHQCTVCEKSFSRAENLKIHFRSHSGEKPYVCPVPGCNKAYSNSSDRFKHTRTHQVDKPYMCKVPGCLKRYTDPSSLRKHVKTYRHFVTVAVDPNMAIVQTKEEVGSVMMFEKEMDDEIPTPMTAIPVMPETEYNDDFPPKSDENIKKEFKTKNNAQCNCRHTCNLAKNNSSEKHFISTLLSLNDASEVKSWDRFWVPTITQKDNGHQVFYTNPIMDLDMPLDLSISRD